MGHVQMTAVTHTDLFIIQNSGLLPIAWVTTGRGNRNQAVRLVFGITRWHALGRAARWARANTTRFVYVQKYVNPPKQRRRR